MAVSTIPKTWLNERDFSTSRHCRKKRHTFCSAVVDVALVRISHTLVGRNEQTPKLPELWSLRRGHFREHGITGENWVCAVPARFCDLVAAYCEKCGLALMDMDRRWR